jgi:hypothetical protein
MQYIIDTRDHLFKERDKIWHEYFQDNHEYLDSEAFDKLDDDYKKDPRIVENEKQTDELRLELLDIIEKYHPEMTFEEVIEGLTSTGGAPSLIYDDDGHFAVECEGIQDVMLDDERFGRFDGTWFTTKESWKPTVREALNYYLDKIFKED